MRFRWDASAWLAVPAALLVAPAPLLWLAAVGARQPPPFAGRAVFVLVFEALPLAALALSIGSLVGGEIGVADWAIDARLRLPRPPWRAAQLLAAVVFAVVAFVVLVAGVHAVAD